MERVWKRSKSSKRILEKNDFFVFLECFIFTTLQPVLPLSVTSVVHYFNIFNMNDSPAEPYDEILTELAGRIGSVNGLLETFFSFLHRKTDFYVQFEEKDVNATMGFSKGVAEAMVLQSFRKYKIKNYAEYSLPAPATSSGSKTNKISPPLPSQSSEKKATVNTAAKAVVVGETSTAGSSSSLPTNPSIPSPNVAKSSISSQLASVQLNDRGQQIPIGNGGIGPNYVWTQTLGELTIYVDALSCSKGKDIKCDIQAKTLRLSILGEEIINGELEDPVRVDESMWTLNVGSSSSGSGGGNSMGKNEDSQVVITLEKTRKTWWKHVIIGHPEIDANKVDSTQRIDEYDEHTQATIRKIMFDQKQQVCITEQKRMMLLLLLFMMIT